MGKREWLINLRKDLGLTQYDVSKKINITQQMYGYIENGKKTPSPKTAKKIGEVLNFDWTLFY